MRRVVWPLRRDLRVTDNVIVHYARRNAASVNSFFIVDPRYERRCLLQSLDLKAGLDDSFMASLRTSPRINIGSRRESIDQNRSYAAPLQST